MVSEPNLRDFLTFWGKARPDQATGPQCHPIAYHLLDVASVAEAILDARPIARARAARLLALKPEEAQQLLVTLVALHDLGKFAPAFQVKAAEHWPLALGECNPGRIVDGRHTDDGAVLWQWELARRVTERVWPAGGATLRVLAPAIFGHHGRPVAADRTTLAAERFGDAGTSAAIACTDTLISLLCPAPIESGGADDDEAARIASWWVAGLVTIADWVGSRIEWFAYREPDDDHSLTRYRDTTRKLAGEAVRRAGLVPPQVAPLRSFRKLTGIELAPSPAQRWAETVELPEGAVFVILEDVTGAGKTEAALMLAHRLMVQGRASGIYWAMPTQATANAMYERQARTLGALFADNSDPRPSLVLSHGQQRLHERFRSSVLGAIPSHAGTPETAFMTSDVDELSGSEACAAFLADDRRAAFLADVGAGTVDQALLGVLPSKFNAVRLFGLCDKVLMVDEAHAYDAYMGVELQELLRFHAALGGCAIVLSATLPKKQREHLVRAWREGLGVERRFAKLRGAEVRPVVSEHYPLATVVSAKELCEHSIESARWSRRAIPVRLVHEVDDAVRHVVEAARTGAAVAWVRNTVDDCLEAARILSEHGLKPLVFHARFAQADRQRIEQDVLARFGPESTPAERRGRVLVATQVIEQSLDLDFDAMVSDIAPVDLLVQRTGRLWRHERGDQRPVGIVPEIVVLAPPWEENPSTDWLGGVFKGTSHVYEDAGMLWRTVRVLEDTKSINAPGGLRALIETVYGSVDVPSSLLPVSQRAEGKQRGNAATAKYAVLKVTDGYDASAHAWLSDLRVPTRLGDKQTVVRLARVRANGSLGPWAAEERPAWKAWALSEVRVSAWKVPFGSTHEARYDAAVTAARKEWGRFEQELAVLPLEQVGQDEWRGRLTHPKTGDLIDIFYNEVRGLAFSADTR